MSLMAQKAEVKYDSAYIMPSQIAHRITELGYNSTVMENETAGRNTVELQVTLKMNIVESGLACLLSSAQLSLNHMPKCISLGLMHVCFTLLMHTAVSFWIFHSLLEHQARSNCSNTSY